MSDPITNALLDIQRITSTIETFSRALLVAKDSAKDPKNLEELSALRECLIKYVKSCKEAVAASKPLPSLKQFIKENLV